MSKRRGVVLVLILIAAAMAASVAGVVLLVAMGGARPTVPANATLFLDLHAPVPESDAGDVFSRLIGRQPTLRSTVDLIAKAARDERVRGLVVRPEAGGGLWAQLQELRDALIAFKAAGKPVTAFLESADAAAYYVASAADRVVLMPAGQLDLMGLASYELFLRGTLDKAGVYPDLLHIGDYKTASNTFTERGFTPAHREMTGSLNADWQDVVIDAVAAGRRMPKDRARDALLGGPYLAEAAQRAGLVDELAYEDELGRQAPIQGTVRMDRETYDGAVVSEGGARGGRIALLYAVGTIASGESSVDNPGAQVLGSDTFVEWLRKARVDADTRAVVVRVDSPGGSAIASEVIWREMMLTRDVKPVIVSMGDVAASGGYYLAAPAHAIVAQPGTLTGSIGVVTGKFVVRDALGKVGVAVGAASDAPMAELYSPFRPFTPAERARLEEQMQATYELFLKRVAEGRRMDVDRVDAVAQGRVWTGRQAREIGLVDQLGGLDVALQLARTRAKIDPTHRVDLEIYPGRRPWLDVLASPWSGALTLALPRVLSRPEVPAVERALVALDRFRRGEPLALMPNVFWR